MNPDVARAGGFGLRARRAAVAAILLTLLVSGCSATAPEPPAAAPVERPTPTATPSSIPGATPAPVAPPAVALPPASVSIPAMNLSEPLIDLGIDSTGVMEVPVDYSDVGWFTGGGRPGGTGPTVIAAHVDDYTGPAVFFYLSELVPGDTVQVTDTAGTVFDYVVYASEEYEKDAFPTSQVFGAMAADELRLITCGGTFDRSIGDYEGNRVVFASRA